MFCHNKPLFRARSEGLGRLAHSVYNIEDTSRNIQKYKMCHFIGLKAFVLFNLFSI